MKTNTRPLLSHGSHLSSAEGLSFMEAAALVSGGRHSSESACVCPVVTSFADGLSEAFGDDDALRTELLQPMVERVVGTRGSAELERRRANAVSDWFIRTWLPVWYDLVPWLAEHAAALRELSPVDAGDISAEKTIREASCAAQDPVRRASRGQPWEVAGEAGWEAAREAVVAAAGSASADIWGTVASVARLGALAAGRDAAWTALQDAEWGDERRVAVRAAKNALRPTVEHLRLDAVRLLGALCDMSERSPG